MKEKTNIVRSLYRWLYKLLDLRDGCDEQSTITNILEAVEFRGVNVWVLFFAIIIASLGLNVNSTAVIIGAMLVSPLMGPIMGIGLSISINDNDLFRKSFRNLLLMVGISLTASTFYFFISPLSDAQSELLARTQPTIYDVLIALFGGLAGIVAASRKQEKVTVVSGVAIATALMPPLCTAGYGLATGQFKYFFGAFYLFFINSFFIALATFIITRYLKFPRKTYVNPIREVRVKRMILLFAIVTVIPSIFIAIKVVKESSFNNQAIRYVAAIQKSPLFEEVYILNVDKVYTSEEQIITLSLMGKILTSEQIDILKSRLSDFSLNNVHLVIKQTESSTSLDVNLQAGVLQKIIENKDRVIERKDSIIYSIEKELEKERMKTEISSVQLMREVVALYPTVKKFSYVSTIQVDAKTMQTDTIPTVVMVWKDKPTREVQTHIREWLTIRLGVSIVVENKTE